MKVCIYSKPFYPAIGGLEQIAKILALEFQAMRVATEVVTDTKNQELEENFSFEITRTTSFFQRYKAFRRSDVVLFMNFTFSGVPIALLARRPLIISNHGIYRARSSLKVRALDSLKRQLTRLLFNISVSTFVARKMPSRSVVIPNAYDNETFGNFSPNKSLDFVFCGRLVSEKGVAIAIGALMLVAKQFPLTNMTIIGDGPERVSLEIYVRHLGLTKNVHFTGSLLGQILVSKLKQHMCMIIPSLCEEAFGIVALEGISCCKTIISSNRGGLPEAVGKCGILVEPTVEKFSVAMLQVLESRDETSIAGEPTAEQRSKHLAKHSTRSVALRYLRILKLAAKS